MLRIVHEGVKFRLVALYANGPPGQYTPYFALVAVYTVWYRECHIEEQKVPFAKIYLFLLAYPERLRVKRQRCPSHYRLDSMLSTVDNGRGLGLIYQRCINVQASQVTLNGNGCEKSVYEDWRVRSVMRTAPPEIVPQLFCIGCHACGIPANDRPAEGPVW